jgi:N-acetylmuramoyl-L-alanine amidase
MQASKRAMGIPYCIFRSMKTTRHIVAAGLLAAGCASGPVIDTTYTALNQESRAKFLVIHYTHQDFPTALKTLTQDRVSSHYLVRDDPPTIYRLVDETRAAWHAGVSSFRGYSLLNPASIGIEIVYVGQGNDPTSLDWNEYPRAQIDAVVSLVKDIVARHKIPPQNVVGHGEIAPQRKIDPGPRFPWKRLADEGLALWPDADEVARRLPAMDVQVPDVLWFQDRLAQHGYAVPLTGELDAQTRRVVMNFQMRYRPARYDGVPDAETAAILDVLVNP